MPYYIGQAPVRRTIQYLKSGRLVFRDNVRIFSMNYCNNEKHHQGAKDFWFWHMPQIQYRNPSVQLCAIKNRFPTPFIRAWLDSGDDVVMDLFDKSPSDILNHVIRILGKTSEQIRNEEFTQEINPAAFGNNCERECICQVPGQVPCPGVAPFPKTLRGKFFDVPLEELGDLYIEKSNDENN